MKRFLRRLLTSFGDWSISVGDYIYNYDLFTPIIMIIGIIVGFIMILAGY